MDAEEARRELEQAHLSYRASVEPRLPAWAPPTCGLLVGAAVALGGLSPSPAWLKVLTIGTGILLALAADQILTRIRAGQGVTGLRGPARRRRSRTINACAVIVICALAVSPDLRWIWAGLGVVVFGYTWFTLQKQVRA
ncbi:MULTISPECIES: hypothetical protein [unclassified Kitasatospora]|uniref:hypothetical protein n=1 Tax=unclassified Kitasatospora TaxID=2633591 RepID=UPI001ADFFEB6|nr:hypothetical protein [Kitasatospora sp. RG8]MBP0452191.1 hypothetical protein [Kitasatospora sp. RG8]